ncbi:hypothetical protein IWW38_004794, partial [Coemansia aciculifera]
MKRPSSCASEADYFNAAVAASESHASGKRTSLYRTSSLSSLLGGGDNNELADDALVPEALGDYRNKLVRLSTMPALSLSALAGDLAESDGVATRCDLAQSVGEAVEAQAPPPRPQFLRRLGQKPSGSSAEDMLRGKHPTTLHYTALVNAAHIPEHRDASKGASRLARFTRQLISGLSFSSRHAVDSPGIVSPCQQQTEHQIPCGSSFRIAATSVATFDTANYHVRSPKLNAFRPAQGGGVGGGSSSCPDDYPLLTAPVGGCGAAERLNLRFAKGRPSATKRSTCLTIPTAKAPLFLPNLLLMPVTSPASASLQTEVATASASTMASPLLHPASAECSSSMFFDTAALLDAQPPLHTAPIVAASAHDMLCRLTGARGGGNVSQPYAALGNSQASPPVSLHADTREEWGLFISNCLKQLDCQVVPSMDSSTIFVGHGSEYSASMLSSPESFATTMAVPSPVDQQALPKYWFSELAGSKHEKFHTLVARGIPGEFRRQVWMECSGALDVRPSHAISPECADIEEIDLDLLRTASTTADHGTPP